MWHYSNINVRSGVKGLVKDVQSNQPLGQVVVQVEGRRHSTKTTDLGEFWRLLLPGDYKLKVCCERSNDENAAILRALFQASLT
jgi:hypothetical protein